MTGRQSGAGPITCAVEQVRGRQGQQWDHVPRVEAAVRRRVGELRVVERVRHCETARFRVMTHGLMVIHMVAMMLVLMKDEEESKSARSGAGHNTQHKYWVRGHTLKYWGGACIHVCRCW